MDSQASLEETWEPIEAIEGRLRIPFFGIGL
jgi:hypothetical protein